VTRKTLSTSKPRKLQLARASIAVATAPCSDLSATRIQSLFDSFFEHAPAPMAIWNLDGTLATTNDASRALFNDAPPLAPSIRSNSIVRKLGIRSYIARVCRGNSVQLPTFWHSLHSKSSDTNATGPTRMAVTTTLFPLRDESNQVRAIGGFFRDDTDVMLAQEQLRADTERLEQNIAKRTEELAAVNSELEAFSYSVSHDLRTPLRAIDGYAARLLETDAARLSDTGNGYLQRIRLSAQRLAELINDLLTFARLGKQTLTKRPVESDQLVELVLQDLEGHWTGREIEIVKGTLPRIDGDLSLLREVFFNLLDNALKFTVHRAHARIEIRCNTSQSPWVWSIRDNGVGFDMSHSEQLFRVFSRLHAARDFEGTGVGLALVQRIVQRHGGKIWARAEKDSGATFYFTLEPDAAAAPNI
jgi:signal transduction histidine kinase